MVDFLDILAKTAKENITKGYYENCSPISRIDTSLRQAIIDEKKASVIAEIKAASPSAGIIKEKVSPNKIAISMERGGAVGISVLTEPIHFKGSLNSLRITREAVKLPLLMKDIIVDPLQFEAALKTGANAVLLIQALFDRGYCDYSLDHMISVAHSKKLEVLLETHNQKEFNFALKTKADLVGINNRDLCSLGIDLKTTKKILENQDKKEKIIVSESGIATPEDLVFLCKCGADAFLIGSAIMKSENIKEKVKEFVSII
ncbi:indole-3-glycerol-phosphate synthase [Candidatus Bathyarchaeota archaeon]|nr:indole-3-glycerol-phosphate synthase [Candidatus Bathyarchaeota archaeon]